MKILGSACFDDFVAWYLQREQTKDRLPSVPPTPGERRALMESFHAGKLWPGCPAWSWSFVQLDVANVPSRIIARAFESPWSGLTQLAGAALFVLAASRAFWLFALRRYSSASS